MCNSCEQGALAGQGMKKGFAVPSPVRGAHSSPGTGRSVTVTQLRALKAWTWAVAWTQQRCHSTHGDTKGFPGPPLPRQDPWPSAALGLQRGLAKDQLLLPCTGRAQCPSPTAEGPTANPAFPAKHIPLAPSGAGTASRVRWAPLCLSLQISVVGTQEKSQIFFFFFNSSPGASRFLWDILLH